MWVLPVMEKEEGMAGPPPGAFYVGAYSSGGARPRLGILEGPCLRGTLMICHPRVSHEISRRSPAASEKDLGTPTTVMRARPWRQQVKGSIDDL